MTICGARGTPDDVVVDHFNCGLADALLVAVNANLMWAISGCGLGYLPVFV